MHSSTFALFLFLALFVSAASAQTGKAIELDKDSNQIDLVDFLQIIDDPRGSLLLDQAIAEFDRRESLSFDGNYPNFGLIDSVYWVKITLSSKLPSPSEWIVELDYPPMDEIGMYLLSADGSVQRKTAGDRHAFSGRDIAFQNPNFSIALGPNQTQEVYFRFDSEGSLQMPLTLWHPQAFAENNYRTLAIQGIYLGIMLALILYNFFIFVATRDKSYLFYILYVFFITMNQAATFGLTHQFLWPNNPDLGRNSITMASSLAVFFAILFCKSYLNVRRYDLRLNQGLTLILVSTASLLILQPLLGYRIATTLLTANAVIAAFALLYSGLRIMLMGNRPARYFFAAWLIFLMAVILFSMQSFGIFSGNIVSQYGVLIGSAIEGILLSLGLADRINTLQKEKHRAQLELIENNKKTIEALKRGDAMKDEFIANVSHELRTPLTGIIGLTELVISRNTNSIDEESGKNLSMIRSSGQRLTSLVNDIIDISAINQNYLKISKKNVDLRTTTNFVLAMCESLIGKKKLVLLAEFPDDLPMVSADEDRLHQILFNLVSNAIKFTFEGSVKVAVEMAGSRVRVSVRDTGIGVSEDKHQQIFGAFEQADSSTQREFGGSGLGLSISRKLLQLHGSDISLQSQPGEGSVFSFELDVADSGEPINDVNRESAEQDFTSPIVVEGGKVLSPDDTVSLENKVDESEKSHTILLIDDESVNLHILQQYLNEDYRLLLAQDGFQALEILESETPHLIITDLMMPRMSGYELCQKVREQKSPADLPIIILTAKSQTEDLVAGLRSGANDYLSKPFRKEELQARVRKQIQLRDMIDVRENNIRLQEQIKRFKEAESKLYTSKRRLARMLDVGSESLISVSSGGDIIHVNQSATELLGTQANDLLERPIEVLSPDSDESVQVLRFPFSEQFLSDHNDPQYFEFRIKSNSFEESPEHERVLSLCILPLDLEQEFFVLILRSPAESAEVSDTNNSTAVAMPELIAQVNQNGQRAQLLGALLARITPQQLQQEGHLIEQLRLIDGVIESISGSVPIDDKQLRFRQSLVDLMQYCISIWEKETQRSVVSLAEESRIWRVNIDNGRLRARSMERYLEVEKLPKNPRWREVTRTAYYLLANLELKAQDKARLEELLEQLQNAER